MLLFPSKVRSSSSNDFCQAHEVQFCTPLILPLFPPFFHPLTWHRSADRPTSLRRQRLPLSNTQTQPTVQGGVGEWWFPNVIFFFFFFLVRSLTRAPQLVARTEEGFKGDAEVFKGEQVQLRLWLIINLLTSCFSPNTVFVFAFSVTGLRCRKSELKNNFYCATKISKF